MWCIIRVGDWLGDAKRFLWMTLLASAVVHAAAAETADDVRPPNIVLILADDLGYVDLGRFSSHDPGHPLAGSGYDSILSTYYETPNIARLAAEGVTFTHAYASPACSPTRASLVSGQSTARHGLAQVNAFSESWTRVIPSAVIDEIRLEHPSVAAMLRGAGYTTALVGKWHIGRPNTASGPRALGFEVNIGGTEGGAVLDYFADQQGRFFTARQGERHPLPAIRDDETTDAVLKAAPGAFLTDTLTQEAIAWLSDAAASGTPFYLHLSYFTPHDADGRFLQAPDRNIARFRDKPPDARGTRPPRPTLGGRLYRWARSMIGAPIRDAWLGHNNPEYAAMIHNMDENIGRVLETLDRIEDPGSPGRSIGENTLVVFMSDNGGDNITPWPTTTNEPLRGFKRQRFEGGIRVPLIIRQPGGQAAGRLSGALARDYDLYATFADYAEIEMQPATDPKTEIDGVSLRPVLEETARPAPEGAASDPSSRAVFQHYMSGNPDRDTEPFSGITTLTEDGRLIKLTYLWERGRFSMFDLSSDPEESVDLMDGIDLASSSARACNPRDDIRTFVDLAGRLRRHLVEAGANVPYLRDPSEKGAPLLRDGVPVSALYPVFDDLQCHD